ncbi:hypothetical protein EYF80_064226 [Liparis tanakae]|uniref:Uncharacterized protein n=1 Tax=Liparis tanakae TaxID=230148 RepID=A0A4Z2EBI3_9TELE|nr:hypothetical protein EYF80_064226 [Liparis tanakae]
MVCCECSPPRLKRSDKKPALTSDSISELEGGGVGVLPLVVLEDQLLEDAAEQLLTGHLQAVLEDGDEVGVGVRVAQLLLDQLEHGTGALGVYVGLSQQKESPPPLCSTHAANVERGEVTHRVEPFGQLRVVLVTHHLKEVQMPGTRRDNRELSTISSGREETEEGLTLTCPEWRSRAPGACR